MSLACVRGYSRKPDYARGYHVGCSAVYGLRPYNAGVHRRLSRPTPCISEHTTTPNWPYLYIAQLGILSYKGGYKDKEEGRPVLENSYYANTKIATVLIRLLWCQAVERVLYALERLTLDIGPVVCWSCFCFLHCSVHFLSHHTQDSLRKGTPFIKDTVNRAQVARKKTSPVQI